MECLKCISSLSPQLHIREMAPVMNILWEISRHVGLSKMSLLAVVLMNVIYINRQMMSGHQQNPDTGRTNRAQRHTPFAMQRDKLWHQCEKAKGTNAEAQKTRGPRTITQHSVSMTEALTFQQHRPAGAFCFLYLSYSYIASYSYTMVFLRSLKII